ncbi:MAG: lytic transglycosylase [Bdellovibrionaceae bacterium]|nr:lytic transglycosylase [Pseudobdellovibrionaceae bacterium]
MVVAWGARVSRTFIDRVIWIQQNLGMPSEGVNWLMACMAWESAESFSPSIVNMAGSGAVGLIQFMPRTAIGLGTSSEELARMSAEDQLNYVYRYFLPYKGRLRNLGDVYMAILWPAGIGKADDWTLWDRNKRPTTYRQNAGLDLNKDGLVTRSECLAKIREKYNRGLSTEFRAVI